MIGRFGSRVINTRYVVESSVRLQKYNPSILRELEREEGRVPRGSTVCGGIVGVEAISVGRGCVYTATYEEREGGSEHFEGRSYDREDPRSGSV